MIDGNHWMLHNTILNMDIFLRKMHEFATRDLYLPARDICYYRWMHFIGHMPHCPFRAGKAQDNKKKPLTAFN